MSLRIAVLSALPCLLPVLAEPAPTDPLCLDRSDCTQTVLWRGAQGERLIRAEFADKRPLPWCDAEAMAGTGTRALKEPAAQLVLLADRQATVVETFCNTGYGTSGSGSDLVRVEGDLLTLSRYGSSNSRVERTLRISLPQLRLLDRATSLYRPSENDDLGETIREDFASLDRVRHTTIAIAAVGALPDGSAKTSASLLIPRVEKPEGYDWRRHALGSCSARVDGRRYRRHGQGEGAEFAMLQLDDGSLIVELSDPRPVKRAVKPLYADHFELWLLDPQAPDDREDGYKQADRRLAQWAIDPFDGSVKLLRGKPASAIRVETAPVRDELRRLRIRFADGAADGAKMTLVYSDSDQGLRQDRLIASSELVFGRSYSLGFLPREPLDFDGADGRMCELVEGRRLEYRFRDGLPFALWTQRYRN